MSVLTELYYLWYVFISSRNVINNENPLRTTLEYDRFFDYTNLRVNLVSQVVATRSFPANMSKLTRRLPTKD